VNGGLTGPRADLATTFPEAGIPSTARAVMTRCLLDTPGCALAGLARDPDSTHLMEVLDAMRQASPFFPPCSVWSGGLRCEGDGRT